METEREYVQNQRVVEQVNRVIREHGDDFKNLTASINAITAFNEIRDAGAVVDNRYENSNYRHGLRRTSFRSRIRRAWQRRRNHRRRRSRQSALTV